MTIINHTRLGCFPGTGKIARLLPMYYNDVTMSIMASKFTTDSTVCITVWLHSNQRNQTRVTGPLWGQSTVGFPWQKVSNGETISIWSRHHGQWSSQKGHGWLHYMNPLVLSQRVYIYIYILIIVKEICTCHEEQHEQKHNKLWSICNEYFFKKDIHLCSEIDTFVKFRICSKV